MHRLYQVLGRPRHEALKTGKPQNEVKHTVRKPMFEELYSDLPRLGAVHGRDYRCCLAYLTLRVFAEKFDFSASFKTLCDVGGATGLLFDRKWPSAIHTFSVFRFFDLPAVEPQ